MAALGFPARNCTGTAPVVENVTWRSRGRSSTYITGRVLSAGNSPLRTVGFCWSTTADPPPTYTAPAAHNVFLAAGPRAGQAFTLHPRVNSFGTVYGRLYAVNARGCVGYAPTLALFVPCFVEGTRIAVRDPSTGGVTHKRVETVGYADEVLTWDFEHGVLTACRPAWIKAPAGTYEHQVLTFSDGATLRVVNHHRIFNADAGRFTQSGKRATPLGTPTFTLADALAGAVRPSEDATCLIAQEVVVHEQTPVRFYNLLVGGGHMNLFAEGILTSCGFNNWARADPHTMTMQLPTEDADAATTTPAPLGSYAAVLRADLQPPIAAAQLPTFYGRLHATKARHVLFVDVEGAAPAPLVDWLNALLARQPGADIVIEGASEGRRAAYEAAGLVRRPLDWASTDPDSVLGSARVYAADLLRSAALAAAVEETLMCVRGGARGV
jgi:hypothetical protein